jgi:hypothetical protein
MGPVAYLLVTWLRLFSAIKGSLEPWAGDEDRLNSTVVSALSGAVQNEQGKPAPATASVAARIAVADPSGQE